jgi:hypothetical protein
MPTLDADIYSFDDSDQEFLDFLNEAGLTEITSRITNEAEKHRIQKEAIGAIKEALFDLSEMPINQAMVEAKARIGRVYFNLHKLLYESALLTVQALLIVKFLGAPAKAAGPGAVKSVIEIIKSIRRLDDEELNVYRAVVGVIKDKKNIIFKQPGASVAEVQTWFEKNKLESGRDVTIFIKQMKEKKILVEKTGEDGGTYYFPNEEWKS